MVRLATRDGINLDAGERIISGRRMKSKRPHRVPLSGRAMEVLSVAQPLAQNKMGLVFPGVK